MPGSAVFPQLSASNYSEPADKKQKWESPPVCL